jgi:outer membrane protein OmpU
MKKFLIATTALCATASVVAAEVRIGGYGRFGLDYDQFNEGTPTPAPGTSVEDNQEVNLTTRLRLQFDMTAETDNGVAFGARYRAQAESRDNNPGTAVFNGARFFVTSGGFTLGVGNIIGAIENMPGLYLETRTAGIGIDGAGFYSVVTNVNNENFNWDAYSSSGAGVNGVEVLYSASGFTGQFSYSRADDIITNDAGVVTTTDGRERFGLMGTYNFGDYTVSGAYQDSNVDWEDKWVLAFLGDIGIWGFRVAYADNQGIDKWGLYGNVDVGAAGNLVAFITQEGAVKQSDINNGRADNRDDTPGSNNFEGIGYGVNYSYDLGGGVSFESGIIQRSNDDLAAQAGVYFSF